MFAADVKRTTAPIDSSVRAHSNTTAPTDDNFRAAAAAAEIPVQNNQQLADEVRVLFAVSSSSSTITSNTIPSLSSSSSSSSSSSLHYIDESSPSPSPGLYDVNSQRSLPLPPPHLLDAEMKTFTSGERIM